MTREVWDDVKEMGENGGENAPWVDKSAKKNEERDSKFDEKMPNKIVKVALPKLDMSMVSGAVAHNSELTHALVGANSGDGDGFGIDRGEVDSDASQSRRY